MFCSNCGKCLNNNEDFCPDCGNRTSNVSDVNNEISNASSVQIISQTMSKDTESSIKSILKKIKDFIINHKKLCIISLILIIISIVGFIIYNLLFGFDKLSWDESYKDSKLEYVAPTNIKLRVDFDNDKADELKYTVTCGEVKTDRLQIDWDLTKATGNCKITVSYKMRKISKEYTVIKFHNGESDFTLDYQIDYDSDEDLDLDKLTNKQEKEYKTNVVLSDTDLDGLDDYYEIFTSNTDPTKKDTDIDGLNDYDEIQLGLDPLKADSKGDGVNDGQRILTYNHESENLKVSITGTGNIASTIAEVNSNTKISNKLGLIDKLYTFYTDGKLSEAIVTITYTDDELNQYGINEDNLSLYYYNEKQSKYEKVETIIDKDKNTLTATLNHFSSYVVGDSTLVKESTVSQVLFVLDNSWSMYTNEQYKQLTGEEYYGGLFGTAKLEGSDANGLRFSLTSNLITRLSKKNYQIGLSEFRRDYANAFKIGSDVETIKAKLSTMNGNFITNSAGTDIGNALNNSINEFSKDVDNKYIVILTDGHDSSLGDKTESIIEKAISNNVKICSIGFDSGSSNVELSNISNTTGCKFYSSGNVDGLTELFENIGTELDDNLVDIDGDNQVDGILVADSGFVVNKDGFSFSNYTTNLTDGHCYGMATFAQLYYKKLLPLNVLPITSGSKTSYAYNLNNTYFENYPNLYDYKLKTNLLKYTFGYEYFDEKMPSDLRTLDGTKLIFTDKYKTELINSGIYDLKEVKTGLSKEQQIERYGVNYVMADNSYINEDKMQSSRVIDNDDLQMFNAIYALFIKQNSTVHYTSGSDFTIWLRTVIGTESIDYVGAQGFINILKQRLNDKDAPVISTLLHALNAISLVQDIDNPNYYYIGVYDNNYPGEKRYIDLECKKDICKTVANKYYNDSGVLRITPSLEYDLQYYNNYERN